MKRVGRWLGRVAKRTAVGLLVAAMFASAMIVLDRIFVPDEPAALPRDR